MTTPEPTQRGISWRVERDLTTYSNLFKEASEVQLQIPNNVNNEYTGVVCLSAQVVFCTLQQKESRAPVADHVISLTNPIRHPDAWASMAISGNQSKSVNLSLAELTNTPTRAHIDLYASAHGCEEFWYTNPPDDFNQQYGMCGGGSTRQIQLLIDGQVAGSQPPFPVVYTGGINPLLWRPQTGIYSFNIPPFFFYITPFLGVLSDGNPHQISVQILGNSNQGDWNVDPVLVLFEDSDHHSANPYVHGTLERYQFSQQGPKRAVTNSSSSTIQGVQVSNVTWVEEYESKLLVETILPGGEVVKLSSTSTSFITNSLIGESLQVTSVDMKGSMSSSAFDRVDRIEYPLQVETDFKESSTSFRIEAKVDQGIQHSLQTFSGEGNTILYEDRIVGQATYNRSTDRTVYVQEGYSTQNTSLTAGGVPCFEQAIAADQGYVTHMEQRPQGNTCVPLSFCPQLDACSPKIINASARLTNEFFIESPSPSDLLFRHPRKMLHPHWHFERPKEEAR